MVGLSKKVILIYSVAYCVEKQIALCAVDERVLIGSSDLNFSFIPLLQ
jgi:hypothetical protein